METRFGLLIHCNSARLAELMELLIAFDLTTHSADNDSVWYRRERRFIEFRGLTLAERDRIIDKLGDLHETGIDVVSYAMKDPA